MTFMTSPAAQTPTTALRENTMCLHVERYQRACVYTLRCILFGVESLNAVTTRPTPWRGPPHDECEYTQFDYREDASGAA
jgi:hypothetical protein